MLSISLIIIFNKIVTKTSFVTVGIKRKTKIIITQLFSISYYTRYKFCKLCWLLLMKLPLPTLVLTPSKSSCKTLMYVHIVSTQPLKKVYLIWIFVKADNILDICYICSHTYIHKFRHIYLFKHICTETVSFICIENYN